MKVQQFSRALWDYGQPARESLPVSDLTAAAVCKRLAPKTVGENKERYSVVAYSELKRFIRPDSSPRRLPIHRNEKCHPHTTQVETHPGGTRWNPTQEQIGILEMLYKGGMRTPNAHQIEQIAEKLARYGKIEGKNVFYWFQNHKARERQKQKRERLGHNYHLRSPHSLELSTARNTPTTMLSLDNVAKEDYGSAVSQGAQKRKCRSWTLDRSVNEEPTEAINNCSCRWAEEGSKGKTLQLFPLHPEGKR